MIILKFVASKTSFYFHINYREHTIFVYVVNYVELKLEFPVNTRVIYIYDLIILILCEYLGGWICRWVGREVGRYADVCVCMCVCVCVLLFFKSQKLSI